MQPSARVRWRCRRGMREMDIIFERFLDDGYGLLDARGRHAFDALLDAPDQDIYAWLLGQESASTQELGQIVAVIRERSLPNPA